jgi:hypothetical protein
LARRLFPWHADARHRCWQSVHSQQTRQPTNNLTHSLHLPLGWDPDMEGWLGDCRPTSYFVTVNVREFEVDCA